MGDVEMSISSLRTRRSVFVCSMTTVSAQIALGMGISNAISQSVQFPHETFSNVVYVIRSPQLCKIEYNFIER